MTAVADALAKAAEAVRERLERVCEEDCFPDDCEFCKLDELKYQVRWCEDVARAVLEATDVAEMAELLGWYRDELERERQHCLRFTMRKSCEGCALSPCDTVAKIERIKAALQRAGKEA